MAKKTGHLNEQGPVEVFAIQSGRVICGLKITAAAKGEDVAVCLILSRRINSRLEPIGLQTSYAKLHILPLIYKGKPQNFIEMTAMSW